MKLSKLKIGLGIFVLLLAGVQIGIYKLSKASGVSGHIESTSAVNAVAYAIQMYEHVNKKYPTQDEGFSPLVESNLLDYYPKDAWDGELIYQRSGNTIKVLSLGPDGVPSEDDLESDPIIIK